MPDGTEQSPIHGEALLRVGSWTVEPALNRLSCAGKTVKLEPKTMALLRYLVERPQQVVSRDALLSAVWPDVVVGDDSLTQAVIKLRKALGDRADAPGYIQTIAKGGYRLVAPVERSEPAVSAAVPSDGQSQPGKGNARMRQAATAAAVVLVALLISIWWAQDDDSPSPGKLAPASAEASRAAQPTIRIAPFRALGDDAQATLLAQGMTADLITHVSKVFGLSVIADTMAARPPDTRAARPPEAGPVEDRPPVQYLVSGSVQRFGEQLRLHVHLAEAQTGKQLWSERFDRSASSLFELQDEIVPKLLQILPAKVSEAELRRVARHHTRSLEAYEFYQRGQMALLARQQEENEQAREMFRRAIELDPSFALAYAALAQTYAADHRNQWTSNRAAALERAFELARSAHELNPDVRETYWVLAFVHLERGQHKQALAYLDTALRLYPSFADAYAFMGGIHAYLGQPAQTLPLLRTAIRLNPDAGYLYYLILGRAYFGLGDTEQARINLERAIMRNPVNLEARVYAAAVQVSAGNKSDAAWEAEEIRTLQPDFTTRTWLATHPLRDAKTQARLVATLAELGF
jgi:DNA-binding winged helix-turn-helix (wHTH) protein/TolB-like protein/Tfp pilus assembly protein PilF